MRNNRKHEVLEPYEAQVLASRPQQRTRPPRFQLTPFRHGNSKLIYLLLNDVVVGHLVWIHNSSQPVVPLPLHGVISDVNGLIGSRNCGIRGKRRDGARERPGPVWLERCVENLFLFGQMASRERP